MQDRIDSTVIEWVRQNLPFFYALMLSLWGGFVQYANRVRMGDAWSWKTLCLDLAICSFAGLIAFFMCQTLEVGGWKAAVVIAISAHEGTRGLSMFINFRDKILGAK